MILTHEAATTLSITPRLMQDFFSTVADTNKTLRVRISEAEAVLELSPEMCRDLRVFMQRSTNT